MDIEHMQKGILLFSLSAIWDCMSAFKASVVYWFRLVLEFVSYVSFFRDYKDRLLCFQLDDMFNFEDQPGEGKEMETTAFGVSVCVCVCVCIQRIKRIKYLLWELLMWLIYKTSGYTQCS